MSRHRGIVSPAYVVQRPLPLMESEYAHWLARTREFASEARRLSYGITSDMWSLRPEDFKVIRSCVPPRKEQTAIVRYLSQVATGLRRYVLAKERLIGPGLRGQGLVEELRARLISDVVTGKLDVRGVAPLPESEAGLEAMTEDSA